jgi:hypothetical protein
VRALSSVVLVPVPVPALSEKTRAYRENRCRPARLTPRPASTRATLKPGTVAPSLGGSPDACWGSAPSRRARVPLAPVPFKYAVTALHTTSTGAAMRTRCSSTNGRSTRSA